MKLLRLPALDLQQSATYRFDTPNKDYWALYYLCCGVCANMVHMELRDDH